MPPSALPPGPAPAPKPATIRPALAADAAAIAALGAHIFAATFGHSVAPHELAAFLSEAYTPAAIAADLADPARDVLVAADPRARGRILGFAYLTRGTSEPCVAGAEAAVELQRIYVDTAAHGQGVGGRLAASIEHMARQQGFRNIWLGVWEENYNARRVYERWGYGRVGEHDFAVGSVVQSDWILIKSLY